MQSLEEDMEIMKKCINACATAIHINEKSLEELKQKTNKIKNDLVNKKVEEEIDRMFG